MKEANFFRVKGLSRHSAYLYSTTLYLRDLLPLAVISRSAVSAMGHGLRLVAHYRSGRQSSDKYSRVRLEDRLNLWRTIVRADSP